MKEQNGDKLEHEREFDKPRHSGLQVQCPVAGSQFMVFSTTQSQLWLHPYPKKPFLQRFWQSMPMKPAAHVHVPARVQISKRAVFSVQVQRERNRYEDKGISRKHLCDMY